MSAQRQALQAVPSQPPAEAQQALRALLDQWQEQAAKLWQITAEIGKVLIGAHKQLSDEDWPDWLAGVGLTPFQASYS